MKTSPVDKVRELYEETAESYSKMMDAEIDLPIYSDILGRLVERIAGIPGPIIDTSCGSGHMLSMYKEQYDPKRPLIGIDLSPNMVAMTSARLGQVAETVCGDMRDLEIVGDNTSAAVLSFFAIHHIDPKEVLAALQEWRRVLHPGGQLVVAAWEGSGPIDYGGETDVVAMRYTANQVADWAQEAGFVVDRCVVEPVAGLPMDAVYLEGTRVKQRDQAP